MAKPNLRPDHNGTQRAQFESNKKKLKHDFTAAAPLKKCVTNITEVKAKDGNAGLRYPEIRGAIIHSDRGGQYTSSAYRAVIKKYGIVQSMNSAGGRCHDNARCESIWARMKEELFYNRGRKSENYRV